MSWETLVRVLGAALKEYDYTLDVVPHMQSYAAQDEKNKVIYLARARRGKPVSLQDAAWSGFHDLGHVVDGRSDQEYIQDFGPTIILERGCDRFGLLEAIKFFESQGLKHDLKPDAWRSARYSTPLHVAEWLQNFNGGKGFVTLDQRQVHQIAEALKMPDSHGDEFMSFCKKVVNKAHLDDMSPVELRKIVAAMVKWVFVRDRKAAMKGMTKKAGLISVRTGVHEPR